MTSRGISAVRGRVPVFLATFGVVIVVVAAVYVAAIPLQFSPPGAQGDPFSYFEGLDTELVAGLITGLVAAVLVVLAYRPQRSGDAGAAGIPPPAPPAFDALDPPAK